MDDRLIKEKVIKYSREDVFNATLKYFNGDELATNVWINKYALKNSKGDLYELTPNDMHIRLTKEIHRVELNYPNPLSEDEIYEVLKDFKYIVPQGGPMSGIGNNKQVVSLSNCFVIGNDFDSYGSIMKVDEQQAQLMKRRGGVGHDLSHIRPKGSVVKNSALTSTGLVPFMERYSNSTREVGQDGRRGALMLSLDVRHPDVEDFIDAKLDSTKVTGANISVKLSDDFMKAVGGGKYTQRYPITGDAKVSREVDADPIFDKIVNNAWKSAEPGILFWDTVINESVSDCYPLDGFKTVSTNPCGEIPLPPYDSCRLLAINLYSYVENPFTDRAVFNSTKFRKHVILAQRIMDDVVDLEIEKIESILTKIKLDPEPDHIKLVERELWENMIDMAKKGRRTGIGITAEGDMLAAMGYTYGTPNATAFSVEIHSMLAISAYKASCVCGQERGSFGVHDTGKETLNPFLNRLADADEELKELLKGPRRNVSLLTIAPTGSVSLMTQTTSGIESAFLVAYNRNRKINPNDKGSVVSFTDDNGDSWETYGVFHHHFITWLEANGYSFDDVKNYSTEELEELIKKSPYDKATSNDVDWVEKVKMQGAIQKWVDHSISVTVNLPNDATPEMVSDVYKMAWESGCKGVTVYRDGSRTGVLVDIDTETVNDIIKDNNAPKRPKKIKCDVLRFQNNKEKWIGFTGLLEGEPYEIFTGLLEAFNVPNYVENGWVERIKQDGKSRYDFIYVDKDGYEQRMNGLSRAFNKEYWNYGKLISGVLRHGMPIASVVNLIDTLKLDQDSFSTWQSGCKRMLKPYIKDGTIAHGESCPMCGNELTFSDGCLTCLPNEVRDGCGWSKCG